jgi:hypothetical protein
MAPKKNPTQTATVHSTDTDTSAGQANNQVVTRRDLDMLAQNLTAAFSEQLRTIIKANAPDQRQTMDEMANQIRNLQEQVSPHVHSSHPLTRSDTGMSRSSRRNKRRREMSKTHNSTTKPNSQEGESKTTSRDARTFLESKRQRASSQVQSMIDRKREERRRMSITGSSFHANPVTKQPEELSQRDPPQSPMLINSPLSVEILATANPAKIKVLNMAAFDGTTCPEEHIMAYKNLMLLYTAEPTSSVSSSLLHS